MKNIFWGLCLSTVLGLTACGQEKSQTVTNQPVGLMSEAQVQTDKSDEIKTTEKKIKTKENQIPTNPVNLNTATEAELITALKGTGIGKAKVANIIAYRDEHGGFKSIDELTQVKGIGQKTLEKARPRLILSGDNQIKTTKKSNKSEDKKEEQEENNNEE